MIDFSRLGYVREDSFFTFFLKKGPLNDTVSREQ